MGVSGKADPFGQTPLMLAAAARNPRCCEALLEAGACVTDEDNEAGWLEELELQSYFSWGDNAKS